ncbi:beta-L-arabinofuranosidase domain-containing protein [Bifidobacterium platyrrhinorum]|uniref:beta-L-arabinofuranosidase domain-containing protein n=1 Tax=Bifidobacterium platyrrhinorum TaxID=2661628 RepID=UPI0013D27406|nr:beta-L-arabinofuranosidase domain-containing protein [Bifidobacterium platyrrhinorum]
MSLTDGEFLRRQRLVKRYVLDFDLDRLLHTFRVNAGLPSDAEPLGGWEAPDCGLRGHFVGHFLSAASKFTVDADNTDAERERLLAEVNTIVAVMKRCAKPNGYVSAFPETEIDRLEEKEFRTVWAPYYTLHKIMQGLVDAYRYAGNEDALTLAVSLAHYIAGRFAKLGYWKIENILHPTRLNPLNEYGGIGEVLYTLYGLTGDESILETAKIFDRDYFTGRLIDGVDMLEDLHANTHLPVVLAAMRRYDATGDERYRTAAENFYRFLRVRTFANGSNSSKATHYTTVYGVSDKAEHWGAAGDLHDALTCGESESCNGHNTELIASELFSWNGDADVLAHVARLKFNAILNCFNPRTGLSQYHQPMGVGVRKVFSTEDRSFWCCTGTGVEGGSDLQKDIWFHTVAADGNGGDGASAPTVVLSAFIASRLDWRERGVTLDLATAYPAGLRAGITVHVKGGEPVRFHVKLRADLVASVVVKDATGAAIPAAITVEGGFVDVERAFDDGDIIEIELREALHEEALLGAPERVALLYGDVLLAALGDRANVGELPPESLAGRVVAADAEGVAGGEGNALRLRLDMPGGEEPLDLLPLYGVTGGEDYSVYLNTDATHPVKPCDFAPVAEGANDPQ